MLAALSLWNRFLEPSLVISGIHATNISATFIVIGFNLPSNTSGINGVLQGYIKYYIEDSGIFKVQNTFNTYHKIKNLKPYRKYIISLGVYNREGSGPYSKPIILRTKQSGKPSVCKSYHPYWANLKIK